jgi:hypothetical protein
VHSLPPRGALTAPNTSLTVKENNDIPGSPNFETEFWRLYPSGRGVKKIARARWDELTIEQRRCAVEALPAWLACEQWQDPRYVVYAERWLRDRRFENPAPPVGKERPRTQADHNKGGQGRWVG